MSIMFPEARRFKPVYADEVDTSDIEKGQERYDEEHGLDTINQVYESMPFLGELTDDILRAVEAFKAGRVDEAMAGIKIALAGGFDPTAARRELRRLQNEYEEINVRVIEACRRRLSRSL